MEVNYLIDNEDANLVAALATDSFVDPTLVAHKTTPEAITRAAMGLGECILIGAAIIAKAIRAHANTVRRDED